MFIELNLYTLSARNRERSTLSHRVDATKFKVRRLHNNFLTWFGGHGKNRTKLQLVFIVYRKQSPMITAVKAWVWRHWIHIQHAEDPFDPFVALYKASATVTGEKMKIWFQHSGYM